MQKFVIGFQISEKWVKYMECAQTSSFLTI